jgi:hypothetical protein
MKIGVASFILTIFLSKIVFAEIPEWYKESIKAQNAREPFSSIILFKVKGVTLVSHKRGIYSYKIDTVTLKSLKGNGPSKQCYYIHSEDENNSLYKKDYIGIVIQVIEYNDECGIIESGYGAPGTKEYIEFFQSIIESAHLTKTSSGKVLSAASPQNFPLA